MVTKYSSPQLPIVVVDHYHVLLMQRFESFALFQCRILKVGVACYDDAQKLHTDHGLCVRGCVDLRYIAARSKSFNIGIIGLKGMAEKVLQVTLNKSYHLRCSDWEADELNEAQVCKIWKL